MDPAAVAGALALAEDGILEYAQHTQHEFKLLLQNLDSRRVLVGTLAPLVLEVKHSSNTDVAFDYALAQRYYTSDG